MKSVRFEAPGDIGVVDEHSRDPGEGEVAVRIDRIGICATDLHMMHGTFPTARYPVTPGHEATGVVAEIGAGVQSLTAGTRVILDPGLPCHDCRQCRRGTFNLCTRRRAFGVTEDGAATEQLVVPAQNLYAVSSEVPAGAAVLGEPLACVIHAFDLVPSPAAGSVLVYGAGTVGLLAAVVARRLGAADVSIIDLNTTRLDRAQEIGVDAAQTAADRLAEERFDIVVDATGAAPAISDGLGRVGRGGSFLQIGVARPDALVSISPYELFAREMRVAGSMTTRFSFPPAVAMLEEGAIPHHLITGTPFSLDQYAEALAAAERGDQPKVTVGSA
ncbi:alcohol dehydrogenase catalytic domain-containing protein [Microbacterium sp. NPDC078428]|uniref:alcohol dehydrogenase catalytic domain-containing protein n=1 Tax=Microbacterium sp. NPDC078428 TaxID=3364190 RepID=UPI0037C60B1E